MRIAITYGYVSQNRMQEQSFFGGYGPTQFLTLVSAVILMYAKDEHICGASNTLYGRESYPQQYYRNKSKHIGVGHVPARSEVFAKKKVLYVG